MLTPSLCEIMDESYYRGATDQQNPRLPLLRELVSGKLWVGEVALGLRQCSPLVGNL